VHGGFLAGFRRIAAYDRLSMARKRKAMASGALPTVDLAAVAMAVAAIKNGSSGSIDISSGRAGLLAAPAHSPVASAAKRAVLGSLGAEAAASSSSLADPFAAACGASRISGTTSGSKAPGTPSTGRAAPCTPGGSRVFPVVALRSRGAVPAANAALTDEDRATTLAKYEADKYAATARGPRASLEATWCRMLCIWHGEEVPSIPVEVADIGYVGALMKDNGYRSFANYVSAMKQLHVKAGFAWTPQHELEALQGKRSVTRGQGPARQSCPLDFDIVAKMALGSDPLCSGGPINPIGVVVLGSAYMLREIEVAFARLAHLRVDTKSRRAYLDLPVSKTDVTAVGCTRVWGCICDGEVLAADCVYHAAQSHLQVVHTRLGIAVGDPLCAAVPLFPSAAGETVEKRAVVETVEQIGLLCGMALLDSAGGRKFGGHSLRVSGAQWLGRLGYEVDQIRTFGRWSSDAVLRYLADSHVADMALVRRRGAVRREDLVVAVPLDEPRASGPQLCTALELDKLVSAAVDSRWSEATAQLRDLQKASGTKYDLVVSEARRCVHAMAGDLVAPSSAWHTRCGWRFAMGPGFRLTATSQGGAPASFLRCSRCFGPPAADG
jgi:hypothetical protein